MGFVKFMVMRALEFAVLYVVTFKSPFWHVNHDEIYSLVTVVLGMGVFDLWLRRGQPNDDKEADEAGAGRDPQ